MSTRSQRTFAEYEDGDEKCCSLLSIYFSIFMGKQIEKKKHVPR